MTIIRVRLPLLAGLLAAVASAQSQSSPAPFTPLVPNNAPDLGPAVINRDILNQPVTAVLQIELRHMAGGTYRCVVTVQRSGAADTKIVAGTLQMAVSPPIWTPSGDLEQLNTTSGSTDEYQCSISPNGLICVWDNYVGITVGGTRYQTFVCTRPNTSVPFTMAAMRPLTAVPAGGCDPHVVVAQNGTVWVYHINGLGISRVPISPTSGAAAGPVVAVVQPTLGGYLHSPFAHLDDRGNAVALTFSEATNGSHAMWTPGLMSDPPAILANANQGGQNHWFANGSAVGGSWVWATDVNIPSRFEGIALASCNLRGADRGIAAYAPISPANPGRMFMSIVALGWRPPRPTPTPPIIGPLWLDLSGYLGQWSPIVHDTNTGLAFWNVLAPPVPWNVDWSIQALTLDMSTMQYYLSNAATLHL